MTDADTNQIVFAGMALAGGGIGHCGDPCGASFPDLATQVRG